MNTDFFKAYDLRGRYPEQISEKEAERLGKAYGTYAGEELAVARDGRKHSPEIFESFKKGIKSTGTDTVDLGTVPTPLLYYTTYKTGLKSGAIVTASHNPPEYTGFKFALDRGMAMSRTNGMKQIEDRYISGEFDTGKGSGKTLNMAEKYIQELSNTFKADIEVAVNYGNGTTSKVGSRALKAIGCDLTEINKEMDGEFPNHLPDPGSEEAQRALMQEMADEDLGVIFDGDGDRAGFVWNGEFVEPDKVLAMFSKELVNRGEKVLYDLRASGLIKDTVKAQGGFVEESRVGHTYISEKIHSDPEIVFAGELSGHFYFPGLDFPWDDAIVAACLASQMVSEGRWNPADLPEYPASPEFRIDCPEHRKEKVVKEIAEKFPGERKSRKDGVKIFFDDGWALIRPSNTEEKISLRCEASTQRGLESIVEDVKPEVKSLCQT